MMPFEVVTLGATLYMPATRPDLPRAVLGGGVPGLRSAVICLEDAIAEAQTPLALANLARLLRVLPASGPARPRLFARPRTVDMLRTMVRLPGAERLDGYVLPKATADTLAAWLAALPEATRFMPTLETAEAFDAAQLARLRRALAPYQDRVPAIRIGGADLLQLLGARRSRVRTAYDGPLGPLIATLCGAFAPAGFGLSAPVFEAYDRPHVLAEEVERDLEHGLLTKTAIHPAQVGVIQAAYAVAPEEQAEARDLLGLGLAQPAVFGRGGRLCEAATHRRWAQTVLARADAYGLTPRRLSA